MLSTKVLLVSFLCGISHVVALFCKTFPGDSNWPSVEQWNALNHTVEGRLIRTVPIGSPCHNPYFNATQCAAVRDGWHHALFHEASATSILSAVFANESCDPFTGPTAQCIVGRYPSYSVNVTTSAHAIAAVNFARQNNIRFIVKNTGHDLMGKNIGPGSLSVWTHNLQGRDWIKNYTSPKYVGPAVRIQAGVIGDTVYQDADERGFIVVGGTCPTVGIAGGYIQGGGHSVLSNLHGLAADQTLEFEVVTPTGRFVRASPLENQDLYWALSGGGGTTYGILWSVTVKVYPDTPVSTGILAFNFTPSTSDAFWDAVGVFQTTTTAYTDSGTYAAASYSLGGFGLGVLGPNKLPSDIFGFMSPLLANLNSSGIPYNLSISSFKKFRDGFLPISKNCDTELPGLPGPSRLVPRLDEGTAAKLLQLTRKFAETGGGVSDVPLRPTLTVAGHPDNAVLPAWRKAERSFLFGLGLGDSDTLDFALASHEKARADFGNTLKQLTPGSGAYMNEADFSDPDWKDTFFGSNYPRLLRIKDKWDPDQLMYGSTAVGGDRWVERLDGRLCRTA